MDHHDYDPEYDSPMADTGPVRRSGAVTAVAVISFVFGGLETVLGLAVMVFGRPFVEWLVASADKELPPEDARQVKELAAKAGGLLGVAVTIAGACFLIFGVPLIIAGVGVLQRRRWGRILTLVMGSISILFAVLSLLGQNFVGLIINAAYAIVVFVILLNSKYAAEFQ